MTTGDVFRRIVTALEEAGIAYMLTGSFASSYHGTPRATQDIDLVIEADERQLETLVRSFPSGEYYVDEEAARQALREETQFNVVDLATGWKVDFIIRKSRPFSVEEFARRATTDFAGLRIPIVTAEDLVIAKLEWAKQGGSSRQIEDVGAILKVRASELDTAYVQRWVDELDVASEWAMARRLAGLE